MVSVYIFNTQCCDGRLCDLDSLPHFNGTWRGVANVAITEVYVMIVLVRHMHVLDTRLGFCKGRFLSRIVVFAWTQAVYCRVLHFQPYTASSPLLFPRLGSQLL